MSKKKRKCHAKWLTTCAFCGEPVRSHDCVRIENGDILERVHRGCLKGYIVMREAGACAGE